MLTVLLVSACQSSTAVDVRPGTGSQYKSTGPAPAGYHRVQRGENLYRIGLRYNQSVATLTRWNGLRDASQIEVGQLIRVSRSATGNVASNTSGNKTSSSKPTGAWSAPSTAVTLLTYAVHDEVNWVMGVPLAIGGLLSISWGVKVAHAMPERVLRGLYCAFLLLCAGLLAIKS